MDTAAVLEHPSVYWKVLHFQRCRLIWSNNVGQWGVLTIDTLLVNKNIVICLCEVIITIIFLRIAFFFRNSGFLFVLFLTVFLVIKHNTCNGTKNSKALSFFAIFTKIWIATWLYSVFLLLGGNVELNPGPKQSSINAFWICHWDLNSLSAHNYAKIFLLKTYIAIHRFDIICIS